MLCKQCNVEMIEGTAILGGLQMGQFFIAKPIRELGLFGKWVSFVNKPRNPNKNIWAYNCPNCKKVEFYTEN